MKLPSDRVSASTNRSMPSTEVIPVLAYPDVRRAVDWLCRSFGFTERLRIGDHRAQLNFGTGAVIVTGQRPDPGAPSASAPTHSIMLRVLDVDAHYERARQSGAQVSGPPTDYPYGERQYSAQDIGGHHWTFSQTIADIDPSTWGGILFEPPENAV
jgi:uncharacterized glyoxalase superfamily protein PhnB